VPRAVPGTLAPKLQRFERERAREKRERGGRGWGYGREGEEKESGGRRRQFLYLEAARKEERRIFGRGFVAALVYAAQSSRDAVPSSRSSARSPSRSRSRSLSPPIQRVLSHVGTKKGKREGEQGEEEERGRRGVRTVPGVGVWASATAARPARSGAMRPRLPRRLVIATVGRGC